ncbi:MAG TPA: Flp pilus assembly protein CpaB [Sideroxyarcus sp.]|nr:Flp pilus assembly protein CpaB [Sideroxyarcus sp.]
MLGKRSMTEKPAETAVPRLNVVVAAKPIPAGVPIARDAVKMEAMTVRPEGAFDNVASVEGRIPVENIVTGETILAQRMYGIEKGIVSSVRPGERAVALKVDEVIAVGNRLNPNDVVDVFAIMRRNNDEISESQSKMLLSGVRVLAVGNRSVQGRDISLPDATLPPRTVVLAVPFNEVNRLALAAEMGKVLLALRSPQDQMPPLAAPTATAVQAEIGGKTTLRQVATGSAPRAGGATPEKGVEVIRGMRRKQISGSRAEQ